MKIEVRADNTVKIEGYVNAVERESRPVITPDGKVNEIIEQRAFERALARAENVTMTIDHTDKVVAQTSDKTLNLYEDNIGLRAESIISDEYTVEQAKAGKIKGWSFGFRNAESQIEQRADKLPLRHIKGFDLDHVALIINKIPIYSATSIELRADNETDIEERAVDNKIELSIEQKKEKIDYSTYENRIKALKVD